MHTKSKKQNEKYIIVSFYTRCWQYDRLDFISPHHNRITQCDMHDCVHVSGWIQWEYCRISVMKFEWKKWYSIITTHQKNENTFVEAGERADGCAHVVPWSSMCTPVSICMFTHFVYILLLIIITTVYIIYQIRRNHFWARVYLQLISHRSFGFIWNPLQNYSSLKCLFSFKHLVLFFSVFPPPPSPIFPAIAIFIKNFSLFVLSCTFSAINYV